jgi:N-acetylneuraminate synthase
LIDPYVNNYKVAATELTNHPLLEKIGSKNKRIYLSVAWPHVKEDLVYQAIDKIGHTNIVLMYCVVDYPAKTQYPLFIPKLQEKFGLKVGYSDHSTDIYANPLAAEVCDAFALEKHFMIRRFQNSPDTCVSMMPEEAKSMVAALKKDIFDLQPSRTEKYNLLTCMRSAIAIKTIDANKELIEGENYKFLRTDKIYLDTIGPHEKHLIEGKKTFVKIPKGDPIMVYHCEEDGLDKYIRRYT